MLTFALCQATSFLKTCTGCSRHLGHLSCIFFHVCQSFRAWNNVLLPLSHEFYSHPSEYQSQIVIIYSIIGFTSFILSFKNVEHPLYAKQPPFWALENLLVTGGKELIRVEFSLWRKGRQKRIQSNNNDPRRKMLVAIITGQNSTLNRVLWHKALL